VGSSPLENSRSFTIPARNQMKVQAIVSDEEQEKQIFGPKFLTTA